MDVTSIRTVLVTGGAGFIGSTLVRQLIHENHCRVVNLDKLTYAGNLHSIAELQNDSLHIFREGDIADRALVAELLDSFQPQGIINLAAESHVDRSIDQPAPFIATNIVGVYQLLESVREYWRQLPEQARAAFRFLHVSSDEVYGSLGDTGKFTESSCRLPSSPYSASKAAADHLVRAFHRTYGLPTLTTVCSNNYGPRQFPEKLIPLIILNALHGEPLPVYGDGQHVRDWLFVEDHCRALRAMLHKGRPGEVYNVGGNCQRTNLEIVRTVCAAVDGLQGGSAAQACESLITFVPDRPGHDRRYALDTSKIENELGWRPLQTLETGLRLTVEWYQSNPDWIESVTGGKYRGERLGLLKTDRTSEPRGA